MTPDLVMLAWAGLIFWSLGQIWFCQIVVYPLFARVGAQDYVAYHGFYARRILLPVIIPGFTSFLAPIPIALWGPEVPGWMSVLNIGGGLVSLTVTLLLAIPRHNRLEREGRDEAVIAELVRFNWPRTLAITLQAGATLAMLAHLLR